MDPIVQPLNTLPRPYGPILVENAPLQLPPEKTFPFAAKLKRLSKESVGMIALNDKQGIGNLNAKKRRFAEEIREWIWDQKNYHDLSALDDKLENGYLPRCFRLIPRKERGQVLIRLSEDRHKSIIPFLIKWHDINTLYPSLVQNPRIFEFAFPTMDYYFKVIFLIRIAQDNLPTGMIQLTQTLLSNDADARLKTVNLTSFINDYSKDPIMGPYRHFDFGLTSSTWIKNEALNDDSLVVPDLKILAHVFGDTFIRDHSLEGMPSEKSTAFFNSYFRKIYNTDPDIQSELGSSNLQKIRKLVRNTERLSKIIELYRNNFLDEFKKELHQFINDLIQELRTDGLTVLPLGWSGTQAHYMLGEIIHDNGFCHINLIDSSTNPYHESDSTTKPKKEPFIQLPGISANLVENQTFFQILLGFKIVELNNNQTPFSHRDFYQFLLTAFNKQYTHPIPNKDVWMTAQRSGICPWKGLTAYLRLLLPPVLYLRVKHKIKVMCLAKIDENDFKKEGSTFFFNTIATKFAQHSLKLFEKRIITEQEFAAAYHLLVQLKETLKIPTTFCTKLVELTTSHGDAVKREMFNVRSYNSHEIVAPSPMSFLKDPDLCNRITTALDLFTALNTKKNISEMKYAIYALIESLPLANSLLPETLDSEQASTLTDKLYKIAEFYDQECAHANEERDLFYRLSLYVLQHKLAKKALKINFQIPFAKKINTIFTIRLSFINEDMDLNLKARDLIQYVEDHFTDNGLTYGTDFRCMVIFWESTENNRDPKVQLVRDWWNSQGIINQNNFDVFFEIFKNQSVLPKPFWNLWNQQFVLFYDVKFKKPDNLKLVPHKKLDDRIECSILINDQLIYHKFMNVNLRREVSDTNTLNYARLPEYITHFNTHLHELLKPVQRKHLDYALFSTYNKDETLCSFEEELLNGEEELFCQRLSKLISGLFSLATAFQCPESYIYTFNLVLKACSLCAEHKKGHNFFAYIDLTQLLDLFNNSQGIAKIKLGHLVVRYYAYLQMKPDHQFVSSTIESLFRAFLIKEEDDSLYLQLFHDLQPFQSDVQRVVMNLSEEEKSALIRNLYLINNKQYLNEPYHFTWPQIQLPEFIIDLNVGQFFTISNAFTLSFTKDLLETPGMREALGDKKPPEFIERQKNVYKIPEYGIIIDKTSLPAQVTVERRIILEKLAARNLSARLGKRSNFYYLNPNTLYHDPTTTEILLRLKEVVFWNCQNNHKYTNSKFETWISDDHKLLLVFEKQTKRVIEIVLHKKKHTITDLTTGLELVVSDHDAKKDFPFYDVEIKEHVLYWRSKDRTVEHTELLSLGLTFILKDGSYISRDYPGYTLELDPGYLSQMPLISLKNENKYLLIVTKRPVTISADNLEITTQIVESDQEIQWYTLQQTVLEGADPIDFDSGFTGEDHDVAHFVHWLLNIHQFKLALKYINKIKKNTFDAKTFAEWIRIMNENTFLYPSHPNLLAVLCHISCSVIQIAKYGHFNPKETFHKRLSNLYNHYLSKLTAIENEFLLSTEQEVSIFDELDEKHRTEAILTRCNKLTGYEYKSSPKNSPGNSSVDVTKSIPLNLPFVCALTFHPIPDSFEISKERFRPTATLQHNFYGILNQLLDAKRTSNSEKILSLIHLICSHQINEPNLNETSQLSQFLINIAHANPNECNLPNIPNDSHNQVVHAALILWVQSNYLNFSSHPEMTATDSAPVSATKEFPKSKEAIFPDMIMTEGLEIGTKRKSNSSEQEFNKAARNHEDPSKPFYYLLTKYFRQIPPQQISIRITSPENHPLFQNAIVRLVIQKLNQLASNVLVEPTWEIKEPSTCLHLQRAVQHKIESCRKESEQVLAKIFDFITPQPNHDHATFFGKLTLSMKEIGGKIPSVDLVYYLNFYLNNENIDLELRTLIERLIYTTLVARLGNQIMKLLKENPNQERVAELMQSCVPTFESPELLYRVRSYFEMTAFKHLKAKQWTIFQQSEGHQKIAFQLPCGSGKTQVMTPLLTLLHSAAGAVINIVPKDNLETNYINLRDFFGRYNQRQVRLFQFNRRTPLTELSLKSLLNDFEASQIKGDLIVGDPQSFQSLELKYFELIVKKEPATKESESIICKLESILFTWMNSKPLLDELQICLKTLHFLNYSLDSECDVEQYRWKTSYILHHSMLALNAQGHKFPIDNEMKKGWTKEYYHSQQRPVLIQHIAKTLLPFESKIAEKYLGADRNTLTVEEREELNLWLTSKPEIEQKELQLLRAHINIYLPSSLSEECFVYYGPSKTNEFACKYRHNMKAAHDTTFENADALINYTIQMFLNTGLSKDQLLQILTGWQLQASKQLQPTKLQRYFSETISNIPIQLMNLNNNDLFQSIYERLHKHADFIFEYLNEYVFPGLRQHPYKLSSSPQDLADILFPKMIAFSGTLLSNYLTLPQNMSVHFDNQADAEILSLILEGKSCKLEVVDFISTEGLVDDPRVCMVLDPRAYFKGKNNLQVAQELLDKSPEFLDAINYFNDANVLTLLKRPRLPVGKQLTVVTYCDQEHTTGTDTVQPNNGIAILIVNEHMTLTDLSQSIKRMRQVGKGQTVIIRMDKQLQKLILDRLNEQMLTPEILILWCILNESKTISDSLLVSFKQQLHAIYRRALLRQIMELRHSYVIDLPALRNRLIDKNIGLLVDTIDQHEFIKHACLLTTQSPALEFEFLIKSYRQQYPDMLNQEDFEQLQTLQQKAKLYLDLPNGQETEDSLNACAQIEQEAFKDVQSEIQDRINQFTYKEWSPIQLFAHINFKTLINNGKVAECMYSSMELSIHRMRLLTPYDIGENLYVTNNALFTPARMIKKMPPKERAHLRKGLPNFKYIMSVKSSGTHKYVVISDKEFNTLRKPFISDNELYDAEVNLSIYNTDGDRWLTNNDETDPLIERIIAQVRFINCETSYSTPQQTALSAWLRENDTKAKIESFYVAYRRKSIKHRIEARYQNSDLSKIIEQINL